MILLIDQSASVLREAAQLVEKWLVKEIIPGFRIQSEQFIKERFAMSDTVYCSRENGGYMRLCVLIRIRLCLLSGLRLRLHLSLCY